MQSIWSWTNALDLYSSLSDYNFPLPLKWDKKRQILIYVSNSKLITRLCVATVLCLGSYAVSSIYLLLRPFIEAKRSLRPLNVILLFTFLALCLFAIGLIGNIVIYGKEGASGFNCLKLLYEDRRQKTYKRNFKPFGVWKVIGLGLHAINIAFAFYPFIILIGTLYLNADPYYFVIKEFLPPGTVQLLSHIPRFIAIFISYALACRSLPLIASLAAIGLLLFNDIILGVLSKNRLEGYGAHNQLKRIQYHKQLQILYNHLDCMVKTIFFITLALFLIMGVVLNYVCLMCYDHLPFVVYIFFPTATMILLFLIEFTVPPAIGIFIQSKKVLRKCYLSSTVGHSKSQRLNRLQVAALRPLCINVGFHHTNIFYLKGSTKRTYYNAIVGYLFTALLSFPADRIY